MSGRLPAYVLLYRSTNEYGEEANVVEGGFRTEQHAKLWADRVVKSGDLIGIIEAEKLTQFVSDHYRNNVEFERTEFTRTHPVSSMTTITQSDTIAPVDVISAMGVDRMETTEIYFFNSPQRLEEFAQLKPKGYSFELRVKVIHATKKEQVEHLQKLVSQTGEYY